jgi:hypothetical protein
MLMKQQQGAPAAAAPAAPPRPAAPPPPRYAEVIWGSCFRGDRTAGNVHGAMA